MLPFRIPRARSKALALRLPRWGALRTEFGTFPGSLSRNVFVSSIEASSLTPNHYLTNNICKQRLHTSQVQFLSTTAIADDPYTSNEVEETSESPSHPNHTRKFVLAFTCNVCKTRNAKKVSYKGYHQGVVIIQCDGCDQRHLISDHKGNVPQRCPTPVVDQDYSTQLIPELRSKRFTMVCRVVSRKRK
jgi:hypothetical protein